MSARVSPSFWKDEGVTDSPETPEPASEDFVQSLARGLSVIRAFDGDNAELTLAEVARRADVPRAAARRFLRTLETLGYVRFDGKLFALTPRILELGFAYLSSLTLPEIVQPHLEVLSHDVAESVSAAVLDGDDIVYIARVATRRIMSVGITIGTRFPAYATSMGRVLLAGLPADQREAAISRVTFSALTDRTLSSADALRAELDRVRESGGALVDGELEPGLRSVATPLHARDGSVIAAINVSSTVARGSVVQFVADVVPRLVATGRAIDAELRLV